MQSLTHDPRTSTNQSIMASPISTLDLLERSLTQARSESNHEQHLRKLISITSDPGGWSTIGNFDIKLSNIPIEYQDQLQAGQIIGSKGGFGVVKRVVVRGVPLAQKTIMSSSDYTIDLIKRETSIGKKVDGHRHIVRLVGTYQSSSYGNDFRHILTFPVAVCDLQQFLDDSDAALREHMDTYSLGKQCNFIIRLLALGFSASLSMEEMRSGIKKRLREITGCITKAIKWIHSQDVQHRDLKPHNIVLRPGQVYITDFGISRAGPNSTTQSYCGHSAGYSAPEVLQQGDINPAQADIYSLGIILLRILTITNAQVGWETCSAALSADSPRRHAAISSFIREHLGLQQEETAKQQANEASDDNSKARPFNREFLSSLVAEDRTARPSIEAVDAWLYANGGRNQIYHGPCCRKLIFDFVLPLTGQAFLAARYSSRGPRSRSD